MQKQPTMLASLVAALGPGLLVPVGARDIEGSAVRGIRVHDPLDPQPSQPEDLIAGIGLDPTQTSFAQVVGAAAEAKAAGIVVKMPRDGGEVQLPPMCSLPVLVLGAATPWTHLLRLVRQVLDVAETSDGVEPTDLFALANVIAWTVGGPVTIEDTASRVLAYSAASEGDIDEPRTNAILGRQVSERYLAHLRSQGVLRDLQQTDRVVRVEAVPAIGLRRRLAVAVRADDEILGYVWVAEAAEPLKESAERALLDAARLAAVHFIRARSSVDAGTQVRQDLLRDLLEERVHPRIVAREFGIDASAPAAVMGISLPPEMTGTGGIARRRRIAQLLLTYASAYRWDVGVLDCDTHLVAVVFGLSGDTDRVRMGMRRLGESLRDADAGGVLSTNSLDVALGPIVQSLAHLHYSHDIVQWMLRSLQADAAVQRPGRPSRISSVVEENEVASLVTMERISTVLSSHRDLHGGPVAALHEIDKSRGTQHIDTLAAWLDAAGDVPLAAARSEVHPNTFRYRMRTISRLTGLSLHDPHARVVAAIHVHLLDRGLLQPERTEIHPS